MPNPYVILHGENTTVFCVQGDEEYLLPVTTEQSFDGKRENSFRTRCRRCHERIASCSSLESGAIAEEIVCPTYSASGRNTSL
jgi:hypothetical protein